VKALLAAALSILVACGGGKDHDTDAGGDDAAGSDGGSDGHAGDGPILPVGVCGPNAVISALPTGIINGTLSADSVSSTISDNCGILNGQNHAVNVYALTLTEPHVVSASTIGSTIDTIVDIRDAACTQVLQCNDDVSATDTASSVTASLGTGTYLILVTARGVSNSSPFELQVLLFNGVGADCASPVDCGPGLVCRVALGDTAMTCQPHACQDGVDDDGDGKNDYPDDPGCTSPIDDDESDTCPSGADCPACANGIDDDGDGLVDFPSDPSCTAASGSSESCASSEPIAAITQPSTTGTTNGAVNDVDPACTFGTGAADVTYELDLPALASLNLDVDTGPTFWMATTELFGASCDAAGAYACSEFGHVSLTDVPAGSYHLLVDGEQQGQGGTFTVRTGGVIAIHGSCEGALYASGALVCDAGLSCSGPTGSRTCVSECSDGIDNNGDGLVDYPADPGCTSLYDGTEDTVCPGANCPQCDDGIDNDGDGLVDWPADPACRAASSTSESCAASEGIIPITAASVTGTTAGAVDDQTPTCGTAGSAPDLTYSLTIPALTSLAITLDHTFDNTGTLLSPTCSPTPLACEQGPNAVSTGALAAGTYYYVVDGVGTANGPFAFSVYGVIPANGSCESPLTDAGALVCQAGSHCQGASGSRTCVPAQCSDGIDNNGDGLTDYPSDPGCTSADDATENTVCPGPGCPACGDHADNDGDGLVDFPADYGCSSASGTSEVFCSPETDATALIATPQTSGTLNGLHDNYEETCQSNTGNDKAYALVVPVQLQSLHLDTEGSSTSDQVLAIKDPQCGTSLACNDDTDPASNDLHSTIDLGAVGPGSYAITVDSYGNANNGPFLLNVNGIAVAGAACTAAGFSNGLFSCPAGTTCSGGTCH
jgi:hypothetical protein